MNKLDQAMRFRVRANELRGKADQFSPENRQMLLNMANNYDAIASQIEAGEWDDRNLKT